MPTYELCLVLRQMARPEVISTLKRAGLSILEKGGVIRKLENQGTRSLPRKISVHDLVHKQGHYFTIEFDSSPTIISEMSEEFGRDIDIIRKFIFNLKTPLKTECTLHEELLPPAYRKEVQEMVKIGQKKQKAKYNYNSGLDYYPFQK